MYEYLKNPEEIERTSFEIIEREIGDKIESEGIRRSILLRVIHTSADYDYIDNLKISDSFLERLEMFLRSKERLSLYTDTNMALSGISKEALRRANIEARCLVAEERTEKLAQRENITRSMASVLLALEDTNKKIFVFGNAPTGIYQLLDYFERNNCTGGDCIGADCLADAIRSDIVGVIGVPVGFVGAQEAKHALYESKFPSIVSLGRKGGSNVAAAIVNALLYEMVGR